MLKSSNFVTSPSSTDAAVGSTEEINVQSDFNGFPSRPRLIFRTGLPEDLVQCEQPEREEPRPVFSHPIRDSWPLLGKEIYVYLDSVDVQWSTIDPIRFALKGAPPGPLHLWIGVNPGSLNLDDAKTAAAGCKSILSNAGFADVEIAFRESILSRLVGPNLLSPTSTRDLEAEIDNFASPFTAALGLYIAPRETPHVEATGGLYICEAGGSDRLFLLTARHAVLPMKDHPDTLYDNMTQTQRHRPGRRMPKHDIILLGQKAYTDAIDSVMGRIGILLDAIDIAKDEIDYCGPPLKQKRQSTIVALQNQIDDLTTLHNKIGTQWGSATMRIIGRVAYAPPIAVIDLGEKRFMEDWALVELDRSKH
ncbi:hypothetical protein SCUCBS95973_003529 [Sporothrix curviconia]|uniref:Uncharacterized protein n=1 Tax=Sporothrix curviconia TaxID=1260050 RepID=A0ABP0BFZ7_9PEZI